MAQAAAQVGTIRNKLRYPGEANDDWQELVAALDDDFNTPDALAVLHRWQDRDLIVRALDLFGLGSMAGEESAPAEVVELAERRERARTSRDFGESDRLRGEIEAQGWEVRDEPEGFRLVRR
jgi:cysteinyl-tRNA synthetase